MEKKALFICVHNSARSQMAEGLLRHLYGDRYEVYSAGTHPTAVHPFAREALEEIGIDISGHSSKGLDELNNVEFDLAVTVCDQANAACPFVQGAKKLMHKGFDDPAARNDLNTFRKSRDEIRNWILETFKGHETLINAPLKI